MDGTWTASKWNQGQGGRDLSDFQVPSIHWTGSQGDWMEGGCQDRLPGTGLDSRYIGAGPLGATSPGTSRPHSSTLAPGSTPGLLWGAKCALGCWRGRRLLAGELCYGGAPGAVPGPRGLLAAQTLVSPSHRGLGSPSIGPKGPCPLQEPKPESVARALGKALKLFRGVAGQKG